MRVLLVGGGAREHALGWALARSPRVDELVSLPGNPGLAQLGEVVIMDATDTEAVGRHASARGYDLVVIGPEAPLAAGLVDELAERGVPAFGPSREAARLESSKAFAKEVMARAGVATAEAATFASPGPALAHLASAEPPHVVKADGLAAGKGVLVTDSTAEAGDWVTRCFDGVFGAAGKRVVIEEYLEGREVSLFAVCTGETAHPLLPARDYKRLRDGDHGPNTGGMGAYAPVPGAGDDFVANVMASVVLPTLRAMEVGGHRFTGFLYAGLVLTAGGPKVLEFNVRLGDPEAQAVLALLETDLIDVLEGRPPAWSGEAAVNVVMAAGGYPTAPRKGAVIHGLEEVPSDAKVFHAGTSLRDGELVADGGRVLSVVGKGPDLGAARKAAYEAVSAITWDGATYRTDIALGDG